MRVRATAVAVAAVVVAGLLVGLIGTPAQARMRRPTKPTHVSVVAATDSSITVRAAVRYATKFRVYAATTAHEVNVSSYRRAPLRSALSHRPQVTLSGLHYRTDPYFIRYTAQNRMGLKFSTIYTVYLRPPTPTGLTAFTPVGGGLALRWSSRAAGGFQVQAATDPAMTQNLRTFTPGGLANSFTPYGLTPGTEYYFRVRAFNGTSFSAYSAVATRVAPAGGQRLRLLSYNLECAECTDFLGRPVSPWSQRRLAAARLVLAAHPDVIAAQEGNSPVGSVRQVDSFAAALNDIGGDYVVADTEGTATADRTGPYLLYRRSTWAPDGAGGRFALPNGRYGAYQLLRNIASGARVLAVSVHLSSGNGSKLDAAREQQTTVLVTDAGALARTLGVPVVYAGDLNSHPGAHNIDGPGVVFNRNGIPGAKEVSPVVVNGRYNSANQQYRTPLAAGVNVDHIHPAPGIAVTGWQMLLNLKGGQFVGVIPSDHNPIVADLIIPAAT